EVFKPIAAPAILGIWDAIFEAAQKLNAKVQEWFDVPKNEKRLDWEGNDAPRDNAVFREQYNFPLTRDNRFGKPVERGINGRLGPFYLDGIENVQIFSERSWLEQQKKRQGDTPVVVPDSGPSQSRGWYNTYRRQFNHMNELYTERGDREIEPDEVSFVRRFSGFDGARYLEFCLRNRLANDRFNLHTTTEKHLLADFNN